MKFICHPVFILIAILTCSAPSVQAQETVFEKPKSNAVYFTLNTFLFTEIALNYRKLLTPQDVYQQGFSVSAGLWVDMVLLGFYGGGGNNFSANYIVLLHSNKRKYSYYELNIGFKLLNNGDYYSDSIKSYQNTVYPGIVQPNMKYVHQYFFMPNFFMGRVFQKNGLYMRFGIGYPSLLSTGVGVRF